MAGTSFNLNCQQSGSAGSLPTKSRRRSRFVGGRWLYYIPNPKSCPSAPRPEWEGWAKQKGSGILTKRFFSDIIRQQGYHQNRGMGFYALSD
jgi:hypothetical protein